MGEITKWCKEIYNKNRVNVRTIVLFLAVFLVLLGYIDNDLFPTDEEEIFAKGLALLKGHFLYKDILSQHMPLMYYLSAFFSVLGVATVTGYRIAFYLLMAFLFAAIYAHYSKFFSEKVFLIYSIGYICVIAYIGMGTCILSEQIQQFGIIILYLEFLIFLKKERINLNSCIWISVAIVLSCATSISSVFSVFVIFLGVVFAAGKFIFEKNDVKYTKYLLKDMARLIGIVLIPWIIYSGYLLATGTFSDAVYWNYSFNREVYSEYLREAGSGSYGSSVIGTYLLGVKNWFSWWKIEENLGELFRIANLLGLTAVLVILEFAKRGKGLIACITFIYIFACSTRGVFTFHGLPCVAIECLLAGIYISLRLGEKKIWHSFTNAGVLLKMGIVCVVFVISSNAVMQIQDIWENSGKEELNEADSSFYLKKLTEENEEIGFAGVNYDYLVEANRSMANKNPSSPWVWEAIGEEIIESFNRKTPRVILYQGEVEVWGYKLKEFAPELDEFIKLNYKNMSICGQESIFVKNNYYEEALKRVGAYVPLTEVYNYDISVSNLLDNDDEILVRFKGFDLPLKGFSIKFGTYDKYSISDFEYKIICEEDNKIIKRGKIRGEEIVNNNYTEIIFEEAVPLNTDFSYELILKPICEVGEEISVYIAEDIFNIESYINGEEIGGDCNLILLGDM